MVSSLDKWWRPVRSRPRISALVLLLVVVLAGGGIWWSGRGSKAAATPSYRLVAASTGTVRQSLSSSGTIEPAVQDALNFAVSGRVTAVRVAAGQQVSAGTVLATVDSASLKANLAQAQAALASDQAKLANDAGGTDSQLAADNASVTAAQGQLSSAQTALAEASLTSPVTGVVATVNLAVGQQVSGSAGSGSAGSGSGAGSGGAGGSGSAGATGSATAGSNSSAGSSSTSQFMVISTNSWLVNATVDDTQVGLLAVGDQAQLTASGATGTVYGTVSSIGLIASSSGGVASYPVVVKVTGNPPGLHAGATGTVSMIYKQLSNVLTVPSTAVHQVGGTTVVYELAGGKQVAHPVTVGLSSGGTSQITAGLTEGTQVVVEIPQIANRGAGGNNRTGRTGFGGGGFGGGGFGGGGLGGGGLGGGGLGGGGGGFVRGGGNGTGGR